MVEIILWIGIFLIGCCFLSPYEDDIRETLNISKTKNDANNNFQSRDTMEDDMKKRQRLLNLIHICNKIIKKVDANNPNAKNNNQKTKPSRKRRPPTFKQRLYEHQDAKCAGCKRTIPSRGMEIDHITPLNAGGTDDDSNLQLLCIRCNRIKMDRPIHNSDLYDIYMSDVKNGYHR